MGVSTKTYRENRAKFSRAQLQQYQGKWVAFSVEGTRIVASADDITGLTSRIKDAGIDPQGVVLERIEMDTDQVFLGAAELL